MLWAIAMSGSYLKLTLEEINWKRRLVWQFSNYQREGVVGPQWEILFVFNYVIESYGLPIMYNIEKLFTSVNRIFCSSETFFWGAAVRFWQRYTVFVFLAPITAYQSITCSLLILLSTMRIKAFFKTFFTLKSRKWIKICLSWSQCWANGKTESTWQNK